MSRVFEAPARVAIERSARNLFAHVELDVAMAPGDSFRLQGPPIRVGFGEDLGLARTAIVRRASPLKRLWTRATEIARLTELYEVSFSGRSLP